MRAFVLPILLFAGAACAAGSSALSKSGDVIEVQVGQTQAIRLQCNPSTGYAWELKGTPDASVSVGKMVFEAGGTQPGAGGTCVFPVRGVKEGSAVVTLVNRRPWDKPDAVSATFTAQVKVVPAAQ